MVSWAAPGKALPAGWGKILPLLGAGEAIPAVLNPLLGSQWQERDGLTGVSLVQSPRWGRDKVYKCLIRGWRNWSHTLLSRSQCQDKRQGAQTEKWEIPFEHRKTLFSSEAGWTLAQAAERSCGVSVHGNTPTWLDMVLGDPAWARGFGLLRAEGTSRDLAWSLPTLALLWFYVHSLSHIQNIQQQLVNELITAEYIMASRRGNHHSNWA